MKIEIKNEHIKLLKSLCVEWNSEYYLGAPAVNIKRPYGNSDIIEDIARIIGLELFEDAGGDVHLSKEQERSCIKLHKEMEHILQIVCFNNGVKDGQIWERENKWDDWEMKKIARRKK